MKLTSLKSNPLRFFWRGARRTLSAAESLPHYSYTTTFGSLAKDWVAVGQDLRHGTNTYRSRNHPAR